MSWCPGRCGFMRRSDLRGAASLHVLCYHGQTDPIRHHTHSLSNYTRAAGPQGVCTCAGTGRPLASRWRSRRVRSRTRQKYWVRRCMRLRLSKVHSCSNYCEPGARGPQRRPIPEKRPVDGGGPGACVRGAIADASWIRAARFFRSG